MGRKFKGCVPLGTGSWVAVYSCKTMWPEPRPTCMLSFILIHLTVWPQYANVIERQTGQTG